jgi:type I restriction enzyme R subunit
VLAAIQFTVQVISVGTDFDAFRRKARQFLRPHENHLAIIKLRRNEPFTPTDLSELERIFVEAGVDPQGMARLQEVGGLGRFVRSLVGLDREAAKRAFGEFMTDRPLTADQLEFLDVVIDYLTERGLMDPKLLYESPFTDFDSNGVEGVFPPADVIRLVSVLRDIEARSAANPQRVPTIHQAHFRGEVRKHLWRAVRPIAPSTSTGT